MPTKAKAKPKRQHLAGQAKRLARSCGASMLAFVVLFQLAVRFVAVPLGRLVWTGALLLSPQHFLLMDSSPAALLQTPLLLAVALLLGMGYAYLALYEITGFVLCMDCAERGASLPLPALAKLALTRSLRVFLPRNWGLLLFTAGVIPLTDFVLASDFFSQFSVPYYIWEVIAATPLYLAAVLALLALLVVWTVEWLFVYHAFVLDELSLAQAARRSQGMVRGQRIRGAIATLVFRGWTRLRYSLWALLGMGLFWLGLLALQDHVATALSAGALAYEMIGKPFLDFLTHCFIGFAQWAFLGVLYNTLKQAAGQSLAPLPAAARPANRQRRVRLLPLAIAVCFAAVSAASTCMLLVLSTDSTALNSLLNHDTLIIAHRGCSAKAPENTLPAYQAAIDCGLVDYGELDVQMTADGVVVLTHDTNLKRCTGVDVNIYDITYAQLQALDASYGYSGASKADFVGTPIPTLDELIKLCDGKLKLNIEIKQNGHSPTLEAEVVRIIRENHFEEQCVISSLNYASLEAVKQLAPELRCGYIVAVGAGNYYDLPAADFFSMETTFVTATAVRELHLRGKQIYAWTVDRADDAKRMLELGVDGMIGDDPQMVYDLLQENRRAVELLNDIPGLSKLDVWLRAQWQALLADAQAVPATAESTAPPSAAELLADA